MADNAADPAVVEQIAEEFLEQHRQGKKPSVEEFCDRYPEHADELRGFLPALVAVEVLKPNSIEGSGPTPGPTEIGGKQLERLGDYRILGEVGRGGMGVVYEAEQESLGRRVALKVLAHHLLNEPRQVKRFLREARAAAKLHHTNIVPVFGVGEQNGHHYYVMQFIQGLGLDEVLDELRKMDGKGDVPPVGGGEHVLSAVDVARSILKERRDAQPDDSRDDPGDSMEMPTVIESDASTSTSVVMPGQSELSEVHESEATYWDGVARIGIQVAEALEHAHEQGTLHRDIKPSNLLLDGHGQVWVTDFGLAKVAEADDLTHTGDILGTIRYMAPERFHGHCDARTDIYSLGITLYELLARRPAYLDPGREQLIKRIESAPPTPLSKTTPGIPRDLETIVNKAIEKDPAHRYKTAQDLADDLQRFVDDEPIHARRISLRERLVRWSRRNPVVASSVSVAAVALVLVAMLSAWVAHSQAEIAQSQTELARSETEAATEVRIKNEALQREQELTQRLLQENDEARRAAQIESARLALEKANNLMNRGDAQTALVWYARALSQIEGNPDASDLEQFIRRGIAAARSHLFPLGPFRTPRVDDFQVSPDGRFVVTRTQVTGEEPPTATNNAQTGGFGGRRRGNEFTLWDAAKARPLWTRESTGGPGGLNFSVDGRFLLVGTAGTGGSFVGNFGSQAWRAAELYDLSVPDAPPQEVVLPSGLMVVGVDGTTVYGLRQNQDDDLLISPLRFDIESGVEVEFEHEIRLPPEGNGPRGLFGLSLAAMSPGGKWLFTSVDNSAFQVWQLDDPSAPPQVFDIDNVSFVRFAPDERHVLVGVNSRGVNGFVRTFQRAHEIQYLALDAEAADWSVEASCGGRECDFSPDGGVLALIESDDELSQPRLTIRSTADGRLLHSMELPRGSGAMFRRTARGGLSFHRQGRSLLIGTTGGVRQFDLPTSSMVAAVAPRALRTTEFGFIHGGDAISACWEDRQEVYDLASGDVRFTEYPGDVGLISDDGSRMVVTSTGTPPVLRIIDSASGAVMHEFETLPDSTFGSTPGPNFSHDRRHFATTDSDASGPGRGDRGFRRSGARPARIHDSFSGELLTTTSLRIGSDWCVSPGGGWLAQWASTNTGDRLELIELGTGESRTFTVGFGDSLRGLAFTSDERRLVLATTARLVVFDLGDPEFGRARFDITEVILDMALLPDDRTILTLEDDAIVRAWDIETGHSYSLALDCNDNPSQIVVSPDGTRLATHHYYANGPRIRVWRLPAPVQGTADDVLKNAGSETGIVLEGRSIRELTLEELSAGNAEADRPTEDLARWHEARAIDAIDDANWRPALWHLERWAQEQPDAPTPWAWSAYCQLQRRDMDAALEALTRVRERTRGRETSFASLVPLLLNIVLAGNVPNDEVMKHLEHQLQLDPDSTSSLLRKATIEANMRRWDDAIGDREAALQRQPDNHVGQLYLITYYLAAGDHDEPLRRHVEWMLDHWKSADDAEARANAALAGLIVLLDPDLTERAVKLMETQPRNSGGGRPDITEFLFNRWDEDRDGELSPEEQKMIRPGQLERFTGLPPDDEKPLTLESFVEAMERSRASGGGFRGRASRASFDDYDSDGDGELSPEEQEALPGRLIANLGIDLDAKQSLTREEFAALEERARRNAAGRIFDQYDSNGDGELSPEEQREVPEQITANLEIDLNAKKPLTREEFTAAMAAADGIRIRLGPPGGGFGGFNGRRGGGNDSVRVQLARGIANYRRGDLDGAAIALGRTRDLLIARRDADKASAPDSTTEPEQNAHLAVVHLFLAMMEHQRENADAAREQMENARALLDAHVDDPTTYDSELEWWIFVREVLKETEETLAEE